MLYLFHLLLLFIFGVAIYRLCRMDVAPLLFAVAYGMKLAAGLVLGYIFMEIYQSGDTLMFFEKALSGNLPEKDQPRTHFFLLLLSPIVHLTKDYWLSAVWISACSFWCCWYFTSVFTGLFPKIKHLFFSCFMVIPSIVFWSSGILKGTVTFPAMGICIALILHFWKKQRLSLIQLILLLLSGYLLFEIKHYLFITVLLFAGALGIMLVLRRIIGVRRWLALAGIAVITITSSQFVHPYLTFSRIPLTLYENNQSILDKSKEENRLDIRIREPNWSAIAREAPRALYTGLLRPTLIDQTQPLGYIHRIENFILTCLILMSIMLLVHQRPRLDKALVFSAISCILMLGILLPLAAPNLGTLVRYKNAYLPYLFLLSSILPFRYFVRKREEND